MPLAQEIVPESEEAAIDDMAARLKKKIIQENPTGIMRRDTHSKMYGVVKAEFIVEPNLPIDRAIGIFKEAKTFQAWIRYSNQDTNNQVDIDRDIRGMAIKLMGVDGKKMVDEDKTCSTHDFILINPTMFIAKNPAEFDGMLKAITGSFLAKLIFFSTHWRLVYNLFDSLIKIANPLQTRYHSTVPYLLGRHAVKYAAIPTIKHPDLIPLEPEDNYLRQAMKARLQKGDAYFDFCVQFQTNEEEMPIENAQKTWSEKRSPFLKVATIKILKQDFDNPAQDNFGENLSFTPWRALPEHRPLGGINRARRVVYRVISAFRHEYNHIPQREPTSWDIPPILSNQDQAQ